MSELSRDLDRELEIIISTVMRDLLSLEKSGIKLATPVEFDLSFGPSRIKFTLEVGALVPNMEIKDK